MPELTPGETIAALSLGAATVAVLVSLLTIAWKQGRSEGKFNEAITNLADSISVAREESKKDSDALWEHQRRQDSFCATHVASQAKTMGEISVHLTLIPGIAESVESLRKETKNDLKQLRSELLERKL